MSDKDNGRPGQPHSTAGQGLAVAPAQATSLLIIEDDENISSAIQEYFSRAGYSVTTAADGLAGVEVATKDRPDVVVLDLMLPKMDGLAVCKELRLKSPVMPILMLTAKDDVVDKVLGLEMGADDYVVKPFSPKELVARVRAVREALSAKAQDFAAGREHVPQARIGELGRKEHHDRKAEQGQPRAPEKRHQRQVLRAQPQGDTRHDARREPTFEGR